MKYLRVKLFAPHFRECSIDGSSRWSAGPAEILTECSERRGLLEHEHEALGEEVDADGNSGCRDDDLWCALRALHAFSHCNDIVGGGLPVEDEDSVMVQNILKHGRGDIGLLERFGEDDGREVMLLLMSLYQLRQLIIRHGFSLTEGTFGRPLVPSGPLKLFKVNFLFHPWHYPVVVGGLGEMISVSLESYPASKGGGEAN